MPCCKRSPNCSPIGFSLVPALYISCERARSLRAVFRFEPFPRTEFLLDDGAGELRASYSFRVDNIDLFPAASNRLWPFHGRLKHSTFFAATADFSSNTIK